MSSFQIDTTQNVQIEHQPASIGERMAATILDLIVQFVYLIIVVALLSQIGNKFIGYLLFLPILFYELIFESLLQGRTPGKLAVKTQVVRLDGQEVHLSEYFLRWLLRLVDVTISFGGVGITAILFSAKGQRLGDMAAGTTVISTKPRKIDHSLFDINLDEYTISYPQVALLNDEDIATLRDVMDFVNKTRSEHAVNIAYLAKQKIEEKLGVQSDLKASDFFALIISDYTAYFAMQVANQ